ncbi:MAG: hypothetical protein JNN24_06460 [Hyphomicrobium zavarzinii]|jgi:hypothetical protein|uniref:hypothetical protein n=1 Tax=Hyphomicrobium zavarzinii TaxID=48292 RepID=UPI001A4F8FA0|nr:hypothetical protein [Hyphomicrobium zavarzinii]MBL8845397.1 hypothetical protein [Hyphomicrobium zavarzinii]HML42363.1 hypothetical protein [Hyphomicrobium zavarzinii]
MRTTTTTLSLGFAALAAVLAATAPARAADPSYVGTWASDLAQCKVGQDRQEAPLVLSKDGYDQHETHCKFKSVDGADGEWKVSSECTIEGSAEPYNFTLTVSGDTLTVTDEAGSRDLLACR